MNAEVLITGGAGFIGLHLANRLLDDGHHVHLVDNFARGVDDADLKTTLARTHIAFSDIDCLDRKEVSALPLNFDVVFHLAAIVGVVHVVERPYSVLMDNMNLLSNVIDHASKQRHLSRFMFASTSEVYAGLLENFELPIPTPEDVPLALPDTSRPRTSYMLSKIAGEALCHYSDLPCTVFRPHNVYGPRMGSVHVVPGQLQKAHYAEDGGVIAVPSVDQTRCFCYIDDAVEMLVRMMGQTECQGQTLNLGAQEPEVTIRQVAAACHAAVGRAVTISPEPPPLGSPSRRCPDMTKTIQLIGYQPQVSLADGIAKTYDWYRKNAFLSGARTAQ